MFGFLIKALSGPFTGPAIASLIDSGERDESMGQLLATTVEDRRRPAVDRIAMAIRDHEGNAELLHDLLAGAIYYRRFVRRVPTTEIELAELTDVLVSLVTPPKRKRR